MRGPDLLHLTIDPTEIFSSTQSASQIPEDLYNYHHWLTGPYSSDGKTFYSLAHSEWYACLLNANDCNQVDANGLSATLNSWANTINSFVSTDGGATWQLNVVSGNQVVAKTAYVWTCAPQKSKISTQLPCNNVTPPKILPRTDFCGAPPSQRTVARSWVHRPADLR